MFSSAKKGASLLFARPCIIACFILSLISSLSVHAISSENNSFFHLHQATGFLELYFGQRCKVGLEKAKFHFAELKKSYSQDSEIKKFSALLKKLINSKKSNANTIEELRFHIHLLQEKRNFPHQNYWHDDIVQACNQALKQN